MRHALVLALLISSGVSVGCGSSSEAVEAIATAGIAVAATGVHRAITGDCWGRCSVGYTCNEKSGFCEPGECYPSCPGGYTCNIRGGLTMCLADKKVLLNPLTGKVRTDALKQNGGFVPPPTASAPVPPP